MRRKLRQPNSGFGSWRKRRCELRGEQSDANVGEMVILTCMKAIFYLPAHPSYFDFQYTQQEVDAAIQMFKMLSPPYKIGEVPVEFVFLDEPGKSVTMVFDSGGMNGPDRWIDNFRHIARDDLPNHVKLIKDLLEAARNKKK
jgi:hypothetical protein